MFYKKRYFRFLLQRLNSVCYWPFLWDYIYQRFLNKHVTKLFFSRNNFLHVLPMYFFYHTLQKYVLYICIHCMVFVYFENVILYLYCSYFFTLHSTCYCFFYNILLFIHFSFPSFFFYIHFIYFRVYYYCNIISLPYICYTHKHTYMHIHTYIYTQTHTHLCIYTCIYIYNKLNRYLKIFLNIF